MAVVTNVEARRVTKSRPIPMSTVELQKRCGVFVSLRQSPRRSWPLLLGSGVCSCKCVVLFWHLEVCRSRGRRYIDVVSLSFLLGTYRATWSRYICAQSSRACVRAVFRIQGAPISRQLLYLKVVKKAGCLRRGSRERCPSRLNQLKCCCRTSRRANCKTNRRADCKTNRRANVRQELKHPPPPPTERVKFLLSLCFRCRRASRFCHISSERTMHVAEALYQRGIISYPRTETEKFKRAFDIK